MASSSSREPSKAPRSPESYESLATRNAAATILQSYEKLSWYSFQRCESLPQTRLHFQNIVAGLSEQDEAALIDWPEDKSPRSKPGEEEGQVHKGKGRISSGSTGGGDGHAGASSSAQKGSDGRGRGDGGAGGADRSAQKKRKSAG